MRSLGFQIKKVLREVAKHNRMSDVVSQNVLNNLIKHFKKTKTTEIAKIAIRKK